MSSTEHHRLASGATEAGPESSNRSSFRGSSSNLAPSSLVVAAALGIMQTGSAIALAALVFTGPASPHLNRGVTSFLIGSALVAVLVAWNTSFEVNVAGAKNTITGVLAAIAAGVAADATNEPALTVAAFVIVTGLVAGVALYGTGRARLGHLVRFIPYPVIGGYVAATGWLIVRGGMHLTIDQRVPWRDLPTLVEADLARLWLPGIALALAIVLVPGPTRQAVVLVAAVVAFWAVVAITSSVDEVARNGWLLGPLPDGQGLALLTAAEAERLE
ncbi:MAG: SulP family inorganic anion transporter [Actinomycetota bacterium]